MALPFKFDFKKPNYVEVFDWRMQRLNELRRDPSILPALKTYYRTHIADFITDWCCTSDPRNVEVGLPAVIPFVLFPKQVEWVEWLYDNWKNRQSCATYKSRELGLSWLSIAFGVTCCLFNYNMVVGFGSRKEEYVDTLGDPKSLFWKARQIMNTLPVEFRGSWNQKRDAPYMKVLFRDTDSALTGEAGDNIGRGARTSLYVKDESAWFLRPDSVEAALSNTTNCCVDISTPHGSNNPFARKVLQGKIPSFRFHWTDDPRKDQAWYDKKCRDIDDPVVIAQELDLDFNASVDGLVIPIEWVKASIDAHIKLDLRPTGERWSSLDVADRGGDLNSLTQGHGFLIEVSKTWSGRDLEGGIYETTERVLDEAIMHGSEFVIYDADGIGASVRGDAHNINRKRSELNPKYVEVEFIAFNGSGKVYDPEEYPYYQDGERIIELRDRTNEDLFLNAKSQGWFIIRERFRQTFLAIKNFENNGIKPENSDHLISISSAIPDYWGLVNELAQPTWSDKHSGKIMIDKKPDGARSPNRADGAMMAFAPRKIRRGFFDV